MYVRNGKLSILLASFLIFGSACSDPEPHGELPIINPADPQPVPSIGQSSFVSADGRNGESTQDNEFGANDGANNATASPAEDGDRADDRTVEEGDIYRVTTTGHILNLNSYRGLQIIDFSDPTNPEIVGRVQVSGTPVEMYQVGNRVYMLLNNWQGYYGSRNDIRPSTFQGGLVMVVDISNPAMPKVTGRAAVDGWVRTSRLTRGNDKEALYVVSADWNNGDQHTHVRSFSVSETGALAPKTEIDLGGYVTEIQATGERLMVARYDWNDQTNSGTKISVIDIGDENGTMVEGMSVEVKGYVDNKYNMDMDGDILRVVSGNSWRTELNTNHVETFDASDLQAITPIDHATFGDGQQLFATLFLGQKAFFVTYRRVDPFHTFEIDAAGMITEKAEFVVSGWNDYFKPVAAQTRLIGIGKNDEGGGTTMAVSLYDITDLTNPNPLISRAEIDLAHSWSEANWDDRAFSVLEKGTVATAPTGETETGLILLPFSGWDDQANEYISAVQIFTFSNTTLTKRGMMDHGTPVRRSFVADKNDNTTGNLSEAELSLFDTTDSDTPLELGRVELAPNYTDFLIFGNHGLRRQNNQGYYWWWGSRSTVQPTDTLQIISLSEDPDMAKAITEIEVPANAQIFQSGDRLVAVSSQPVDQNYQDWETEVLVWDLTTPTVPHLAGSHTYDDLPLMNNYYGGYWGVDEVDGCFDCYYYNYNYGTAEVVGEALVVPESKRMDELEGTLSTRSIYPADNQRQWDECWDDRTREYRSCSYYTGSIRCSQMTRVDGTVESEVCTGSSQHCEQDEMGARECENIDESTIETRTDTWEREQRRYWSYWTHHVVDLSDPANLGGVVTVDMASNEEAVNSLTRENNLYLSFKKPIRIAGDSRPYVAYYFREIGLANPANPQVAADVNIPGQLLDVDGNTLITRDYLWGVNIVEASINRLELQSGQALLKGVHRFVDEEVRQVHLDGAGRVLVSHAKAWLLNYEEFGYNDYEEWDRTLQLSILDVANNGLPLLSTIEIDDWANLQGAVPGRALFTVPGGLLIVNLDDVMTPYAQAYFPLRGWPQNIEIQGRSVYFAAGQFGLYEFDVDTFNLLPNTAP